MKSVLKKFTVLAFLSILFSCKKNPDENTLPPTNKPFFIRAVDLSFTPEISSYNITYFAGDTAKPILQLVKDKGINTVRLRLWYQPATVHSSLSEVLQFAQQIKSAGLKFWLDFHYSDSWADPANQYKPAAWSSLTFDQLCDSVYTYTKNTVTTFNQNGAAPDYIQIGNETNNGMLWNDGIIYSGSGENWDNFRTLVQKALAGAREASPNIPTIIHYAGYDGAVYYFQKLTEVNADFNIIALSYYPAWHGKNLDSLETIMHNLSNQFHRPVLIAETAYPWTLSWNDYTNNLVGLQSQLISEYPATPEGQANFISKVISFAQSYTISANAGVCYWAPDWVAYKGTTATDGSTWENMTLFDFQNKALPALDSLGKK